MRGRTIQRSRSGIVTYTAAILRRVTGDQVRIIHKTYIERWTGTKWVRFMRRGKYD